MRENELRQHAVCSICQQKIGHSQESIFYRVKIDLFAIDMKAMRRQDGLTAMLGDNAYLASVMGPDENLAVEMSTTALTVCYTCALSRSLPVAALTEHGESSIES